MFSYFLVGWLLDLIDDKLEWMYLYLRNIPCVQCLVASDAKTNETCLSRQ